MKKFMIFAITIFSLITVPQAQAQRGCSGGGSGLNPALVEKAKASQKTSLNNPAANSNQKQELNTVNNQQKDSDKNQ